MIISFAVNKQKLSRLDNQEIVADSKNYLIARFALQSIEWQNNVVYALFSYKDKTYKKILGAEDGCDFNECYIPYEVIHSPQFTISLYAGDRITSTRVKIPVESSGYTENIINEKLTENTLDQMNNLLAKYAKICNNILQDCKKIKEEIES